MDDEKPHKVVQLVPAPKARKIPPEYLRSYPTDADKEQDTSKQLEEVGLKLLSNDRPHKVVALVPQTPNLFYVPPEFRRRFPNELENNVNELENNVKEPEKGTQKLAVTQPQNTVLVITTPPELRHPGKENQNAPMEGLQHHFITRTGSLSNVDEPGSPPGDSFGEKYVDVVDTEIVNKEEAEYSQSCENVTSHLKKIYMAFTAIMLCDATFSALAMYSVDHIDTTYAHRALAHIFTNKDQFHFHIIVMMFVIASFPLVGFGIIAYPKPNSKYVSYGRWSYFVIFELYLISCLISYSIKTANFYETMEAKMIKDLHEAPEQHTTGHHIRDQKFIILRDFTHNYYGCCGVYGYQDWTEKLKNNSMDRQGYPVGCCDNSVHEHHSHCFPPLQENIITGNGKTLTLINKEGCLYYEVRWTRALSGTFMAILCFIIILTIGAAIYLRYVIHLANKYEIDLVEISI